MTGAPPPSAEIPPPRDDDDDDVAWALQTAQVQWKRGAHADAIVWLRRAAESAVSAGEIERAGELNLSANQLTVQVFAGEQQPDGAAPPPERASDVDALLGSVSNRLSAPMASIPIDIDVEPSRPGLPADTERSLATVPPVTPPPPVAAGQAPPRAGQRGFPPPPPPRPPPPPPRVRPIGRPTHDSDPTFVTSAPPLDEMFEQRNRANEFFPPPPQSPFGLKSPAPGAEAEPERELGSFHESNSDALPEPHSTLAAPPPEEHFGQMMATDQGPSLVQMSEPPLEPTDEELLGDEDFPPSSEQPISARIGQFLRGDRPERSASQADSEPTLQDQRLEDMSSRFPRGGLERASAAPEARSEGGITVAPSAPPAESDHPFPMAAASEMPLAPSFPIAAPGEASIRGIALSNVQGLQDLPEEAQHALVESARIEVLAVEEEISNFGVALVLDGWVTIMPTIADAACAHAAKGAVVFTAGTLSDGVALRVVSGQDETVVAVWDGDALERATQDCPWVADELRVVADRFQALAGVTMGAMGDRLDDSLRALITDRCEVRTLLPYEVLVEKGATLPGMHIVGGGRVEIIVENPDGSGEVEDELGPGDFLFAPQVLGGATAPATARAGKGGALVLFADRMTTHELLVSVPPLLELLAG